MPAGVIPLLKSWKIGQRRKSTSKRSRKRALKRVTASFCSGNSLAGNSLTESTLSIERWFSGSKVRRVSISSSNRSMRYGNLLPIGNRSINEPRTVNSPCSYTVST
ncbi:hypothetical protein D3C86_1813730 [compost metagenome]